jgi:hypothetical protein
MPNTIAVAGASFDSSYMRGLETNLVVVFDNEPRNGDLCKQIKKCINNGYAVALMPETGYKDINDLVKAGWSIDRIMKLIDDHTYSGLEAEVVFGQWKKI